MSLSELKSRLDRIRKKRDEIERVLVGKRAVAESLLKRLKSEFDLEDVEAAEKQRKALNEKAEILRNDLEDRTIKLDAQLQKIESVVLDD